jgi:hypothetical protein
LLTHEQCLFFLFNPFFFFFFFLAFGGGRAYHGGDYRLSFHHEHNAGQVMNAAGASRWMKHMGEALCETNFTTLTGDVRVKPCIVDFLRTKMNKYAKEFRWKFDENDFNFVLNDPEIASVYDVEIDMSYTADRINTLGVKDLKKFLKHCKVDYGDVVEKSEMQKLASAALDERVDEQISKLSELSPKELKTYLKNRKLDYSFCVEKSELVALAVSALNEKRGGRRRRQDDGGADEEEKRNGGGEEKMESAQEKKED